MNNPTNQPAILVMDDDEDVRFIADYMLSQLGFAVVLTAKGTDAITCFRSAMEAATPFHAVILDINIPGSMGGGEVLKHLKEITPRINAFISSGNPYDPMMVNPEFFGFSGAVTKPFCEENLRILLLPSG